MCLQSRGKIIIPGSKAVYESLRSVKKGQIISLSGYLVNVTTVKGKHWKTSLTREDSRGGACEIFLVVNVWLDPGYSPGASRNK